MADASPPPESPIEAQVDGNRLRLLTEGRERLDAILDLIASAKKDLRLLYYMMTEDDAGTPIREALIDAVNRGVDVSLLVDRFGSSAVKPQFYEPIKEAGGDYCLFHPSIGRRYLIRNHQKLAIADGRRALIGGSNLNIHYFEDEGDQRWRDLWLRVDGPIVAPLADYFDSIFRWTRSKRPRIRQLRRIITRHSQSDGPLQWKFSGPMRRRNPWPEAFAKDLMSGKQLDIVSAYFSPSRAMLKRIYQLALRGGTARVVTAAKSDNTATIAAARHTYSRLLKRGVETYEYQPARLHTKLYIVDDAVHIGSSNFDFRSLYLNLEIMLRIEDRAFAGQMRGYVDGEIAHSRQITADMHRARASIWKRTKWAMSNFLVTSMDYTVTRRINFGLE